MNYRGWKQIPLKRRAGTLIKKVRVPDLSVKRTMVKPEGPIALGPMLTLQRPGGRDLLQKIKPKMIIQRSL